MNRLRNEYTEGMKILSGQMGQRMNRSKNEYTQGWIDRRTDRWVDVTKC